MRVSPGSSGGWRDLVICLPTIVLAPLVAAQAVAPPPLPAESCGNGLIEPGEACDDGNRADGDGCTSLCTIEERCYDPGDRFSFFSWSDSYPGSGDAGVEAVLKDATDPSRHPGRPIPRFWISTGDVPYMREGKDRLDELDSLISGGRYPFPCRASNRRFPYFVALGNHDLDGYTGMTPQAQLAYWRDVVGARVESTLVGIGNLRWGPSGSYDQRTTYSFDYKNAHFVIVNQYFGDPSFPTGNPLACIRPALLEWIDRDLRKARKGARFVFGHEPAWPYCSQLPGYGGEHCPPSNGDNQTPPYRPRPTSRAGSWTEAYGAHWGDSLESAQCPEGSRDAFWRMLARHGVVAHFVGHTHTYSSSLVTVAGVRRRGVGAYDKKGQVFDAREGVWEVDTGQTHNSAGTSYVLTTVRGDIVTFEAFDRVGSAEPFQRIETWSVRLPAGSAITVPDTTPPEVRLSAPASGARLVGSITLSAEATDAGGIAAVRFLLDGEQVLGEVQVEPYSLQWDTRAIASGPHTLTAEARDEAGNIQLSQGVSAIVDNPPPSTRFRMGQRIRAAVGFAVRAEPTAAAETLAIQPAAATGMVTGGPVFADGFWWWQIDFDEGRDGWSAEEWLEPAAGP